MSLIFEMAVKAEVKEALHNYLYNNLEVTPSGGYNDTAVLEVKIKRRVSKMSWMDFSDKELRIVNEVEKKPGMQQDAIIAIMKEYDADYPDGDCGASMTKFLLANLCDRKVLIASTKNGYALNDSDTPPPCKLPILPPA